MRFPNRLGGRAARWCFGAAALALVAALPAISQDAPESILPPGFGDPVEETRKPNEPNSARPADLIPDVALQPPPDTTQSGTIAVDPLSGTDVAEGVEEGDLPLALPPQDLPAQSRRSLDHIGVLTAADGGFGEAAFGSADGRYLAYLMRNLRAPIASRWASIALRRAILSDVTTPANVNPANWAAERAWLLLRMGEADAALMLVQAVDPDRYSPRLQDVALQAALATADPAAACAFTEWVDRKRTEQAWPMMRAICAALSGESAQASAQIDAQRNRGSGRGIDGLLAEKVVGAGNNTRRSVKIEWEGVKQLTSWRFGLAAATAVDIPEPLYDTVGRHVRAWQARAAMLEPEKRQRAAETAAVLGVMSSEALVDFYGLWADATDPAEQAGKPFLLLRAAYAADSSSERLSAMQSLWAAGEQNPTLGYARNLLTARAAARLKPEAELSDASPQLIASMLSAGLDVQAARWARVAADAGGEIEVASWGLLASGAPTQVVPWTRGALSEFISDAGAESPKARLMFAGLAGLGRLPDADISDIAGDLGIPVGRQTAWTRALERAVAAREPGTVALLSAVGLQGSSFGQVSPKNLYHAVSALRRVGLAAEARMLAAEAVTRS